MNAMLSSIVCLISLGLEQTELRILTADGKAAANAEVFALVAPGSKMLKGELATLRRIPC